MFQLSSRGAEPVSTSFRSRQKLDFLHFDTDASLNYKLSDAHSNLHAETPTTMIHQNNADLPPVTLINCTRAVEHGNHPLSCQTTARSNRGLGSLRQFHSNAGLHEFCFSRLYHGTLGREEIKTSVSAMRILWQRCLCRQSLDL